MANILKLLTTFYKWLFNKKDKKKDVIAERDPVDDLWSNLNKGSSTRRSVTLPSSPGFQYTQEVDYIRDINGEKCYKGDVIIFNHQYIVLKNDAVQLAKKHIKIIKAEEIDLNYYITKEANIDE